MTKELDLMMVIRKFRMLALSTISLLSSEQRKLIGHLCDNMTTHDESELDSGSESVEGTLVDPAALATKFSLSEN